MQGTGPPALSLLPSRSTEGDPAFIGKFKTAVYPLFRSFSEIDDSPAASLIYGFALSGLLMAVHRWYNNRSKLPVKDFISLARSLIEKGILRTFASIEPAAAAAPRVSIS